MNTDRTEKDGEIDKYSDKNKKLDFRIPKCILEAYAHIKKVGIEKYGEGAGTSNFVADVGIDKAKDMLEQALHRHLFDIDNIDDESGYPHLWHVFFNVCMLIEIKDLIPSCYTDHLRYATYIDDNGRERFRKNRIIIKYIPPQLLNDISRDRQLGLYTLDEVKELYRLIGYSISGYTDVFADKEE